MDSRDSISNTIIYKRGILITLPVLLFFIMGMAVSLRLNLDRRLAGLFFSAPVGWPYQDAWPWRLLYDFGTIPGLLLTLIALTILMGGLFYPRWKRWRKPMLVVTLTSIVGAGLLVNAILKPYCGRPRPREIVEFNGQWEYSLPCFDSTPGKGMSFPCGHCTMGFLFVTLAYCRKQSKWLAIGGTVFGLLLGALLGVARAAQGAHFLTDIIGALGVIILTSLMVYYFIIPLFAGIRFQSISWTTTRKTAVFLGFGLLILIITGFFLTRRPYFETRVENFDLPVSIQRLIVHSNIEYVKIELFFQDRLARISVMGQGFATPNASETVFMENDIQGQTLIVNLEVRKSGYFSELRHRLQIILPAARQGSIQVDIRKPVADN